MMNNAMSRKKPRVFLSVAIAVSIAGGTIGAVESRAVEPAGGGARDDVKRALDELNLSDDQKRAIEPIYEAYVKKQQQARDEFLRQMKEALNNQQYGKLVSATNMSGGAASTLPSTNPSDPAVAKDVRRVPITFSGGYETDPQDRGRPVVLIAAALGVPPEVFRKAFSNVRPAPAGQEPDPGQVRKNKAALMDALSPYGVTNDRLDTVSNFYRYQRERDGVWRNTPATADALVRDGNVVGFQITNPGAGYSSPPTVSVPGFPKLRAEVTLESGTDFAKNGSIKDIKVN